MVRRSGCHASFALRLCASGALICCGFASQPASAFETDAHAEMTKWALELFTAPNSMPRMTWSEQAIREIQNANLCVDVGDSNGAPDFSTMGPCVPAALTSGDVPVCRECHFDFPERHFDGELIHEGSAWLRKNRDAFVSYARQGYYVEARKVLGVALHTIQDFYAHSNWVDLGNEEPFYDLTTLDAYAGPPYSAQHPAISSRKIDGTKIPLCWRSANVAAARYLLTPLARALTLSDPDPGTDIRFLTTGYFSTVVDRTPEGKCAHTFMQVAGIDKDKASPNGQRLYNLAQLLARRHSHRLINDALRQLDDPESLEELYNPRTRGETRIYPVPAISRTRIGMVRRGDYYEFQTDPEGEGLKIVWGRRGLLGLGEPTYCGPEGTPGVGPTNHSLWVNPPVPGESIGALIGSIYPEDCMPGGQEPCLAVESFLIGCGVVTAMPASGQLFLLVNDGVLINNSGYFKVAVTHYPPPEQGRNDLIWKGRYRPGHRFSCR